MKHILLFLTLTTFSLLANPFQTILEKTEKNIKSHTQVNNKFYYAQKAAKEGNMNAQFDLAMMYGTGINVKKSERKAFNWLHKSAVNGHLQAKYLMGVSFNQGTGVKMQKKLAQYWFRKAAKAGHPKAIFQLATIERVLEKKKILSKYALNSF